MNQGRLAATTPPPLRCLAIVDWEEVFDWNQHPSRQRADHKVVWHKQLGNLHAACVDRGIIPLYAISYPLLHCPKHMEFFTGVLNRGEAVLGMHMHPWTCPPFESTAYASSERAPTRHAHHVQDADDASKGMFALLESDLAEKKLTHFLEEWHQNFLTRPRVFRAGRHGMHARLLPMLARHGFYWDASGIPPSRLMAGVDFATWPREPTLMPTPDGAIGVMPAPYLTQGWLAWDRIIRLWDRPWAVRSHLPGLLSRLGAANRVFLNPEFNSIDEQLSVAANARKRGCSYMAVAMHSTSVVPGATTYAANDAQADALLSRWCRILDFLRTTLCANFDHPLAQDASQPNGTHSISYGQGLWSKGT